MRAVQRGLLDAAGITLVLLCLIIIADRLLEATGATGLFHADDLVRELLVAAVALPLAAATAERAHLSLSIISDRLAPTERARMVLLGHAVGLLGLLPLIAAVLWAMTGRVPPAAAYRDAVPDWIGLALLLAGLAATWLRLGAIFLGDLQEFRETGFISGDSGRGAI